MTRNDGPWGNTDKLIYALIGAQRSIKGDEYGGGLVYIGGIERTPRDSDGPPKPGATEATLALTNKKVMAMIKNPPNGLVYSGHPVEILFTVEPDSNGKRGDLLLNYRVPFTKRTQAR